jgi:hypothetical protein
MTLPTALTDYSLELGNFFVQKIHQKYVSNPEAFDTLKKMLVFELNAGQSKQTSSATLSLLWLNRLRKMIFFKLIILA